MRAIEIQGAFGLENLTRVQRPDLEPGPGQVRVRVHAASLNYRDLLMVRGQYNPRQPLPLIPLSDGVGTVDAVGPGTDLAVGTRVIGLFAPHWLGGDPTAERIRATLGGPLDGMLAESILLPEAAAVPVPAYLSDAEAATLPCAALTAWSALVTHGSLKAGDTVLVQGTGGVSSFALAIARMQGARVIATSSREERLEQLAARGAWKTINYKEDPKWGKTARELTGGRGVDHVVEVGGAGTLGQSLRAVRPGGCVSLIGVLAAGVGADVNLMPVLMNQVRVQGILVGHREGLEAMLRAFEAHELRPLVDRVFAMEDTVAAFEHLAAGRHCGKVCIQISAGG